MLMALRRHCDLKVYSNEEGEGKGRPVIFWIVFMTLWRALLSAVEQLTYHTVIQYVSILSIEQG